MVSGQDADTEVESVADGRDPRGSHIPPDYRRQFLGWLGFTIIQIPTGEFTAMTKALRHGTRPFERDHWSVPRARGGEYKQKYRTGITGEGTSLWSSVVGRRPPIKGCMGFCLHPDHCHPPA